jgi:hypothetical protein
VAFEVLHGEDVLAVGFEGFVSLHDVAMVQAHGDARLVEEHMQKFAIRRELRPDLLHDHELVETERPSVDGQEDAGHSPVSERHHELVAPNPGTGRERRTHGLQTLSDARSQTVHGERKTGRNPRL